MGKTSRTQFISNSQQYLQTTSLEERIDAILENLQTKHNLEIIDRLSASDYYGTGKVGALHFIIKYEGQTSVLKVQGVKPSLSESEIITKFNEQNQSKIIRPPKIYLHIDWQQELQFEALVMEYVQAEPLLKAGKLHTKPELNRFFQAYQEYRQNCRNQPWLEKPSAVSLAEIIESKYQRLKTVAQDVKPDHPYRKAEDQDLVAEAVAALVSFYQGKQPEFVHGHFSVHDLLQVNEKEVVLLSNLFWKWLHPFADAVFAYHWFMYSLAGLTDISVEEFEQQRTFWLDQIYYQAESDHDQQLVTAALLERAAAGLLIDAFAYTDPALALAEHSAIGTRQQLIKLLNELE